MTSRNIDFANLQYQPELYKDEIENVKNRDELQGKLKEQGVPAVHYLIPLHLQECFEFLGYKKGDFPISELITSSIMSLPMNSYVSDEEIKYIQMELLYDFQ